LGGSLLGAWLKRLRKIANATTAAEARLIFKLYAALKVPLFHVGPRIRLAARIYESLRNL
jgi:hypothetical protein